jgi:hypothetical protein
MWVSVVAVVSLSSCVPRFIEYRVVAADEVDDGISWHLPGLSRAIGESENLLVELVADLW